MTLPTFVSAATGSETSVTPGSHTTDDLMITVVAHANSGTTIATPSGHLVMPGTPVDAGASNIVLSGFYRFATSGAMGNVAISGTVNNAWATTVVYRGVNKSSPFFSPVSGIHQLAASPIYVPGITTLANDSLYVGFIAWALDDAGPLGSSPTNFGLGSVTERYDGGTVTNNGSGLYIFDGTLATKATIEYSNVTFSTGSICSVLAIALQSADTHPPTRGRKSQAVNRSS